MQRCDPTQQTHFKLTRIHGGEDCIESIVRRNAGTEMQISRQPCFVLCGPFRNGDEIIRAADDSTERHDDEIQQRISWLPATWIGEILKVNSYIRATSCGDHWPLSHVIWLAA